MRTSTQLAANAYIQPAASAYLQPVQRILRPAFSRNGRTFQTEHAKGNRYKESQSSLKNNNEQLQVDFQQLYYNNDRPDENPSSTYNLPKKAATATSKLRPTNIRGNSRSEARLVDNHVARSNLSQYELMQFEKSQQDLISELHASAQSQKQPLSQFRSQL